MEFGARMLNRRGAQFHAAHRLRQAANAPIIVKFVKLIERDAWLAASHLLADHNNDKPVKERISLVPDLPPALREPRRQLLVKRKAIKQQGNACHLKYVPSYPFIKLVCPGHKELEEEFEDTQETIVLTYIGLLPLKKPQHLEQHE